MGNIDAIHFDEDYEKCAGHLVALDDDGKVVHDFGSGVIPQETIDAVLQRFPDSVVLYGVPTREAFLRMFAEQN
jgi:hypothetical protein